LVSTQSATNLHSRASNSSFNFDSMPISVVATGSNPKRKVTTTWVASQFKGEWIEQTICLYNLSEGVSTCSLSVEIAHRKGTVDNFMQIEHANGWIGCKVGHFIPNLRYFEVSIARQVCRPAKLAPQGTRLLHPSRTFSSFRHLSTTFWMEMLDQLTVSPGEP